MHPNFKRLCERLDTMPTPVTLADPSEPDIPIVYCNRAFMDLTGYARDEVLGNNCRFLQAELTDQPARAELRNAIETGESVSTVLTNFTKNGEAFRNLLYMDPLKDINGTVQLFMGCQYALPQLVSREMVDQHAGMLSDISHELKEAQERARSAILASLATRADLTVSLAKTVFG